MKKNLAVIAALLAAGAAQASCVCRCVDGEVQPICSSAMDMSPMCAPRMCGKPAPSIAPMQAPQMPPMGTQQCRQVQVRNPYTHQYEWQTVCS
jgi:hypothetical protein